MTDMALLAVCDANITSPQAAFVLSELEGLWSPNFSSFQAGDAPSGSTADPSSAEAPAQSGGDESNGTEVGVKAHGSLSNTLIERFEIKGKRGAILRAAAELNSAAVTTVPSGVTVTVMERLCLADGTERARIISPCCGWLSSKL